jgi:glucose/arabinose dehydrogenase
MTDYPAAAEFKKATTPIKSFVAKLGDPKLTAPELVGAKTAEVAAPAPSARRGAGIQDFFVSDAVGSFVNDFCDGEQPWSVVVDPQDRLVVGSPSGGPCYRVSPSGDGFAVRLYDGPYVLIEDAGEALGSSIGAYPTVGDAFDAVVEHAGLDDANSPSP